MLQVAIIKKLIEGVQNF